MATWKLLIEYDGTKYSGWQEQKNARTVQGELRKAAEDMLSTEVDLHGAGRTDAGVHALAQVAHLRAATKKNLVPQQMVRMLNERLPADVVVIDVERVDDHFHARHDAVMRRYAYRISTRKSAFSKRYIWWIREPLDVPAMSLSAKMLAGRHNFVCFRAPDPSRPDESTIVVVDSAAIEAEEDLITFRIEASHFLWRMVRRIVGVLVKLGKHEITMHDFERLLAGHCDPSLDVASWTAPASGLFLEEVIYREKPVAKSQRRR